MLKAIMEILDVPRHGKKEELIDRLMTWLEAPKDSGRKIPQPKRKSKIWYLISDWDVCVCVVK